MRYSIERANPYGAITISLGEGGLGLLVIYVGARTAEGLGGHLKTGQRISRLGQKAKSVYAPVWLLSSRKILALN
jgi:hypothetical protein